MSEKERIIISCDPGHDDAVALAMAKGLSDKIKVEAVIATFGNQVIEKTLTNALNLAQALELDAPVYKGSEHPLLREQVVAGYIHGENGLAGPEFPPCTRQCQGNGITKAIELVLANPGEITFIAVGPWTDLALCIKAEPKFAKSLKRIVCMGGSLGKGNCTESAEFNVFADPEAAQIVYNCGAEVVDFGLDVTLQVMLNEDILNKARAIKQKNYTKIFLASMNYYTQSCIKYIHDYPAMHDPCTIAYLVDPSIFEFQNMNIQVDTKSSLCYGRTISKRNAEERLVKYGVKADADKFWKLFFKAVDNLP